MVLLRSSWRLALVPALLALLTVAAPLVSMAQPSPTAYRYYEQGIAAFNQGNPSLATQYFEQAATVDPTFIDAWFNLGSVQFRAGNYDKAKTAFERVVTLNPSDYQASYNLGLSLEKLQQTEDAMRAFQKVGPNTPKFAAAQEKLAELGEKLGAKEQTATKPTSSTTASTTTANANEKPTLPGQAKSSKQFAASLAGPTGMALGPQGEVYVANYSRHSIVKIMPDGQRSTLVEGKGLNGPIGLVRDPRTGNFYVANYLKGDVLQVNTKGQTSTLASGLKKPYSLLLDSLANVLYVTEQGSNSVSKIQL